MRAVGVALIAALAAGFVAAESSQAATILDDTFDLGAATRDDDTADPLDTQWWSVLNVALSVTTDAGGINDGNTLSIGSTSTNQTITAGSFGTDVALSAIGDSLTVSFDFRLLSSATTGFRFGVYDEGSTLMSSDGNAYFQGGDDDGYLFLLGFPDTDSGAGRVIREVTDDPFYLSPSNTDLAAFDESFSLAALGTTPHSAELTLALVAGGVRIDLLLDGGSVFGFDDTSAGALTSFNAIGIGSFDNSFLIDNVQVRSSLVPEPSTLPLLTLAAGTLVFSRRRRIQPASARKASP